MPKPTRSIAIGDIHGCLLALKAIIAAIDLQPEDTIITLGDYIDRGPDSKGVLDQLIELEGRCNLIPLKGDHDEMLAVEVLFFDDDGKVVKAVAHYDQV